MRMESWFCYSVTLTCCSLCDHTVAVQALIGHRYGAASLPTQVEVSQYQLLMHEGQKAGISTREVEQIYQRDENSMPPSYRLVSPFRRSSGLQVHHFSLFLFHNKWFLYVFSNFNCLS